MKNKTSLYVVVFLFMLIIKKNTYACDVCGCAASGGYNGILPQYKANMLGFLFNHQNYAHPNAGIAGKDYFYNLDLQYRKILHPKILFSLNVPLSFKQRIIENSTENTKGIGDIKVFGHFFLVNNSDSLKNKWKHTLQAIAGLQLPTGHYQQRARDLTMLPAGMQSGSGSWSLPLMLQWTVRKRKWGANTDYQIWWKSANEQDYQPGLFQSASTSVFYWGKKDNKNLILRLGMQLQRVGSDKEFNKYKKNTGGSLLKSEFSIDYIPGKYSVFLKGQKQVWTNLPSGQPVEQFQLFAGMNWFIRGK